MNTVLRLEIPFITTDQRSWSLNDNKNIWEQLCCLVQPVLPSFQYNIPPGTAGFRDIAIWIKHRQFFRIESAHINVATQFC